MSYDRVLPDPVALRNDSAQVSLPRPSNLLDHKIMDRKVAMHDAYDTRSSVPQAHQHIAMNRSESRASKPGPTLTTKELQLPLRERSDRSSTSSASSNGPPVKSKDTPMQFCLCQPDPKIPRPRNGESVLCAPSSELGKCFSISDFDLACIICSNSSTPFWKMANLSL